MARSPDANVEVQPWLPDAYRDMPAALRLAQRRLGEAAAAGATAPTASPAEQAECLRSALREVAETRFVAEQFLRVFYGEKGDISMDALRHGLTKCIATDGARRRASFQSRFARILSQAVVRRTARVAPEADEGMTGSLPTASRGSGLAGLSMTERLSEHRLLVRSLLDHATGEPEVVEAGVTAWVCELGDAEASGTLTREAALEAVMAVGEEVLLETRRKRLALVLLTAVAGVLGAAADVAAGAQYLAVGRGQAAAATWAIFMTACVVNALVALSLAQPRYFAPLSFLGLKQAAEAYVVTTGQERPGQLVATGSIAKFTKIFDIAFRALPMSAFQIAAALGTGTVEAGQAACLFASLSAAVFGAVLVDRGFDGYQPYRAFEPLYFGVAPPDRMDRHSAPLGPWEQARAAGVVAGQLLFGGGFLACRIIGIASMHLAAPKVLVAWMFAEFALYAGGRVLAGSAHFYKDLGKATWVASSAFMVVGYVACAFLPVLLFRNPFFGGPHVAAVAYVVHWALAWGMVVAASNMQSAGGTALAVEPRALYGVLTATSAVTFAGATLMALCMVPRLRRSFWRRWTLYQHLEWHWDAGVYAFWGNDLDSIRASVLEAFSCRFWPAAATDWLSARLPVWDASPPEWYTPITRERLQRGLGELQGEGQTR